MPRPEPARRTWGGGRRGGRPSGDGGSVATGCERRHDRGGGVRAPTASPVGGRPARPALRRRTRASARAAPAAGCARPRGRPRPASEARQLSGAIRAAGEVAGDRRRLGRVARHQTLEPLGLDRRELEELPRLAVFHHHPSRRARRIGTGWRPPRAPRPGQAGAPAASASSPFRAASPAVRRSRSVSAPRDTPGRSPSVPAPAAPPAPLAIASELRRLGRGLRPGTVRAADSAAASGRPALEARAVLPRPRRPRAAPGWAPARRPQPVDGPVPGDRVEPRRQERSAGSNSSARFQSARNVSCTTSSATCRSDVSRSRRRGPRRRAGRRGRPAPPATRPRPRDEGRVVGDPTSSVMLTSPGPSRFQIPARRREGQRPPLEAAREHDVGLGREHVASSPARGAGRARGRACRGRGS